MPTPLLSYDDPTGQLLTDTALQPAAFKLIEQRLPAFPACGRPPKGVTLDDLIRLHP